LCQVKVVIQTVSKESPNKNKKIWGCKETLWGVYGFPNLCLWIFIFYWRFRNIPN
jgi:hypothetical protein